MNTNVVLDKHEVVVDRDYLEKLQNDSAMLECLDACKVTNWSGYDEAVTMFEKENTDEGEEYGL
jgi:spermidine/putrescine-binding protein